ncbi:MAG: hypothetical protein JWR26_4384 [Pedosphaera sp.]|nr:hypothetical protein [Pedosphaera sp.]
MMDELFQLVDEIQNQPLRQFIPACGNGLTEKLNSQPQSLSDEQEPEC